MKIPKYIERIIELRVKSAETLNALDNQLAEWLEKNEIEVESYDTRGGCEMYSSPDASAERIRNAIYEKE